MITDTVEEHLEEAESKIGRLEAAIRAAIAAIKIRQHKGDQTKSTQLLLLTLESALS